jgi:hypothetical protein
VELARCFVLLEDKVKVNIRLIVDAGQTIIRVLMLVRGIATRVVVDVKSVDDGSHQSSSRHSPP